MARLESEAESARSMKEAKYEQFALGEYINLSMTRADRVLRKRKKMLRSNISRGTLGDLSNTKKQTHTHRSHWKGVKYESECENSTVDEFF